jgi:hypothetical protein
MKYPLAGVSNFPDVAVVIPSFKCDYVHELVTALERQTRQPTRIFILQDDMHVLLNFSRMVSAARRVDTIVEKFKKHDSILPTDKFFKSLCPGQVTKENEQNSHSLVMNSYFKKEKG